MVGVSSGYVLETHGAGHHTDIIRKFSLPVFVHNTGTEQTCFYGVAVQLGTAAEMVGFTFKLPDDYVSGLKVYMFGYMEATGDAYFDINAQYGGVGETYQTNYDVQNEYKLLDTKTINHGFYEDLNIDFTTPSGAGAAIAAGDFVSAQVIAGATASVDVLVYGFEVEYMATG